MTATTSSDYRWPGDIARDVLARLRRELEAANSRLSDAEASVRAAESDIETIEGAIKVAELELK